ncbi:MAG: biotin/lipoyl-binding protein, partial [Pirellula sp.]|nr:biotin/lipoyl-binding protein [Pirellula sp.]
MKKTFVVSAAIAIALVAGLSAVPQVRSLVHGLVPSLGIEGGASQASTPVEPSVSLGNTQAFQESNQQIIDRDIDGKLVDIDQPSSHAADFAIADRTSSEEADSHILLAQSTEPARTLNTIQTAPSNNRVTKLSSFEQVPNEGVQVPSASVNGVLVDTSATLVFVNDLSVPAQADGIITNLLVDEGSIVRKGELVYQLDPRLANAEIAVQTKEL